MTTTSVMALSAIALVAFASALIGSLGVRLARSTSDFLVASRTVGPASNAGAISGEYLSAASFLGIAGLILRDGVDALWYPVGFTAGYLALLLFVAAPLRRSGAYTVPDFAEARLRSTALRKVCTAFVVVIGWLYLLPQLQGAGLTLTTITGWPPWAGATAAAVIVVATVMLGGMRSITFVQAFQYWLKLTALALPAAVGLIFFLSDDRTFDRPAPPQFPKQVDVQIRTDVELQVASPVTFVATGEVDGVRQERNEVQWEVGRHTVRSGAVLEFPSGAPVPVVAGAPVTDQSWLTPFPEGREQRPARHLLADHRAVPGHHGAAARAGPLLHQPGRPGRPAQRGRSCWPCSAASTSWSRCSARCPGSTPRSCWSTATPTPRCCCCPARCWAAT